MIIAKPVERGVCIGAIYTHFSMINTTDYFTQMNIFHIY